MAKQLIDRRIIPVLHHKKKGGDGMTSIQFGPLVHAVDGKAVKIPYFLKSSAAYQDCNLDFNKHNAGTWSTDHLMQTQSF